VSLSISKTILACGVVLAVLAVAALTGAPTALASPRELPRGDMPDPRPATVQDVLVRFRSDAGASERADARDAAQADFRERLPVQGLQRVDPEPGVSAGQAVAALERSPEVLYAEPDAVRTLAATPNDRLYSLQWGLNNSGQQVSGAGGTPDADIDAPEAWERTTGDRDVTVAVVDTGVDSAHPDLRPNLWRNAGEIEGNGIDDDGNGLVDDSRGWDFVESDNMPDDGNGHGTHVAGTAGARGNDENGVAGVAWNASVMPVRVLGSDGSGSVSGLIKGYGYAARKGAQVVNASLGGGQFSRAERDAIAAAPDSLFVVAAGNDGADNDSTGSFPCNYDLPNLVCVASTGQDDQLSGFSNRGRTTVDLAAPGESIASAYPGGRWVYLDGTSMATPHVAGAAALVLSQNTGATPAGVRQALLGSVDDKPSLSQTTVTGGRLNAHRALLVAAGETPVSAPAAPGQSPAPSPGSTPAPAAPAAPAAPVSPAAPALAPPVLSLRASLRSRQSLKALRRGLRTRLGCSVGCRLSVRAVIHRRTARRLRLGSGRSSVRVGGATGRLEAAGSKVLTVRFSSRLRRRLSRGRAVRLTLLARAVDSRGRVRTLQRRVLLRR